MMRTIRSKLVFLATVSAGAMFLPANVALAQQTTQQVSATQANVEEVIVTARRRSERSIDVPATLNVFGGEDLDRTGVKTLTDLQYQVPGLSIAIGGGGSRITLRGVGTNISSGAPSVAVHLDGIYIPVTNFAIGEQFDIGRIEVLKGPQGTLYGRNATGGVVNVVSRAPGKEFGTDGFIGYGDRNLITAQGGVSLPLGDRGGVRVSGAYASDEGYTKNINRVGGEIDDRNFSGARLRANYDFTDALSVDFTAQYSKDKGTLGFGGSNNPASPVLASAAPDRISPRRINVETAPKSDKEGLLLAGTVSLAIGDVTLKSITGFVDYKALGRVDVDGAGALIAFNNSTFRSKSFSQEFQLSGGNSDALNWTLGAYYGRETVRNASVETDANFPDPTPFIFSDLSQRFTNTSYAVFGEVSAPITEKLSVVGGVRFTQERQSGTSRLAVPVFGATFNTAAEADSDGVAPKLLFNYERNANSRIYASVTRGLKSGGVNLSTRSDVFLPEEIWAYEIGTKNQFADGKAEISLSAFYYDYTNLQLRSVIFTSTGFTTRVNNASEAVIQGVEATAVFRPSAAFSFDINGAYVDSELKNFILPGTTTAAIGVPLPLTPEFSITAGGEFTTNIGNSGKLTARAEVNFQSEVLFPNFGDIKRERQGDTTQINANLRYDLPGEKVYVALIGRNLTDETFLTQRFFFAGFADIEFYGQARTIEARVGFKF